MSSGNVNYELVREGLRNVIDNLHLNPNAFATMIGTDSSNFLKKLKGTLSFSRMDFEKFKKANINIDYLLTGEGNMYLGPVNTTPGTKPSSAVPVYEEEFSCGFLSFNDSALRPIGYVDMPGTRGATCWCKATGDSMRPLINNGDYVCIKRIDGWQNFIVFGDIYAIDTTNDMRMIKRIVKGSSTNEYELVSENDEYKPQPLKKSMIRGLFRVLAVTKIL